MVNLFKKQDLVDHNDSNTTLVVKSTNLVFY